MITQELDSLRRVQSAALATARALADQLKHRLVITHTDLFDLTAPARGWERRLDDALIKELRLSYDDQDGLLATHLPAVGQTVESLGFSSLLKLSLLIQADGVGAGKMTLTVKRNGTIKIGPVYLRPEFRHRRHAVAAVDAVATVAGEVGFSTLLATVPDGHGAAITAARAHMRQVARLQSHYRTGRDELVFIRPLTKSCPAAAAHRDAPTAAVNRTILLRNFVDKSFHEVDTRWDAWLAEVRAETASEAHRFIGKPHLVLGDRHEAALMIFKRGRTGKIIATTGGGRPSAALLDECINHGRALLQRKLSLFWPSEVDADFRPSRQWQMEAQLSLGRNGSPVRIFSIFL